MKSVRRLMVLGESLAEKYAAQDDGYGGKVFSLPPDHKAGMRVSHGGSSCATCRFGEMREDGPHCKNTYWVKWNGGESRLPVDDPLDYCSDWWMQNEKVLRAAQ